MLDENDYATLFLAVSAFVGIMCLTSYIHGTVSARRETEEKTIVYCMEQPSACKTKYDYYKLENKK
jgi:hypothetical protein